MNNGVKVLVDVCHYFYVKGKAKWKIGVDILIKEIHVYYLNMYAYYLKLLGNDNQEMTSNVPDNWEEMWHVLDVLELFEHWVLRKSIL